MERKKKEKKPTFLHCKITSNCEIFHDIIANDLLFYILFLFFFFKDLTSCNEIQTRDLCAPACAKLHANCMMSFLPGICLSRSGNLCCPKIFRRCSGEVHCLFYYQWIKILSSREINDLCPHAISS